MMTQEEIDNLLDFPPNNLGSPEFEKLYYEYNNWRLGGEFRYKIDENNPELIMQKLEKTEEKYKILLDNYSEFLEFKEKFKKIIEEQPEILL